MELTRSAVVVAVGCRDGSTASAATSSALHRVRLPPPVVSFDGALASSKPSTLTVGLSTGVLSTGDVGETPMLRVTTDGSEPLCAADEGGEPLSAGNGDAYVAGSASILLRVSATVRARRSIDSSERSRERGEWRRTTRSSRKTRERARARARRGE